MTYAIKVEIADPGARTFSFTGRQAHWPGEETAGRSELNRFARWNDGRPETELNFKFYRQATNKIVGISEQAAAFLEGHF